MEGNRYVLPAAFAVILVVTVTGCGGPRLAPVLQNGEIVADRSSATVDRARLEGSAERERLAEQRGDTRAFALATCAPEVCAAIARNELALGMTEAQVLATTGTTIDAWEIRPSGAATIMASRPAAESPPTDALAEIAFVTLRNGVVASYTYREPYGFRTVSTADDATLAGRASASAQSLLLEGDAYAAAGRLDLALERYDRADILRPDDPETSIRIATTLDKQLRPVEAAIRYRLFLHQLELERIDAQGEAAARLAEAIALAQQRLIILDQR